MFKLKTKLALIQNLVFNIPPHPLAAFISTRLAVLCLLSLAANITLSSVAAREGLNFNPVLSFTPDGLGHTLQRVFSSADASWYLTLAQSGYDVLEFTKNEPHNWVFFPLLPILIRVFAAGTEHFFLAGVFLSNALFLASLFLIHRLALKLGSSKTQAQRSVWLLALYPASYFLMAPLTESLFLFLLLCMFSALESRRMLSAGMFMAFLGAARPTGILLFPVYLAALYEQKRLLTFRAAASIVLAAAGPLAFMFYLYLVADNPLAWLENQQAWGRFSQNPIEMLKGWTEFPEMLIAPWNFRLVNLLSALLACTAGFQLLKEKKWSFALLLLIPVAAALVTGTLQSMCRFVMVLFPLYLVLARWCENPIVERIVFALFAGLLSVMTLMYGVHITAGMA